MPGGKGFFNPLASAFVLAYDMANAENDGAGGAGFSMISALWHKPTGNR
jgi:hypothetical protein